MQPKIEPRSACHSCLRIPPPPMPPALERCIEIATDACAPSPPASSPCHKRRLRCRRVARDSKRTVQDDGRKVSFFCIQLKIFAMPSRKAAASTTNNDSSLSSRSSRSAARPQPPASPPASPAKSIAKSTKRYAFFHCISLPLV
jgi:hypothetical protein